MQLPGPHRAHGPRRLELLHLQRRQCRGGAFVGTATNIDTEKTVKINVSGSFSVVEHSDGTVTITSHGAVLSSLFGTIFHGRTVIQLDANGDVISRTTNGTVEDLCAELAGP